MFLSMVLCRMKLLVHAGADGTKSSPGSVSTTKLYIFPQSYYVYHWIRIILLTTWIHLERMMTSSNGNIFRVAGLFSPVNSPHKGQWRGALVFSLICAWIHVLVNSREAVDLRRHRAHFDVFVMQPSSHRTSNVKLAGTWIPFTAVHPMVEGKWVFYLLEPDP